MLVVDDSRFVRASLARELGTRFRVRQAESGERAWELLLLDASIGAVLSDLTMPGIDGFELLRRVRGSMLPRLRDMPFAILSGADDAARRERAREAGADRFIVKGGGVDQLADWLSERLARLGDPEPAHEAGDLRVIATTASAGRPVTDGRETPVPATQAGRQPDPLQRWFLASVDRIAAGGEAVPVLIRLHAQGLDDLPARLRRGIRAADALHLETEDTAWLCVPASAPLALRLALRFGLLAAGRQSPGHLPRCPIAVCLQAVEGARPLDGLAAMLRHPPTVPSGAGLALRTGDGAWGAGWTCSLPWSAARLLVS